MKEEQVCGHPNAEQLAGAFSATLRTQAIEAGQAIEREVLRFERWRTEYWHRFPVRLGGETLHLPSRLYLLSSGGSEGPDRTTWLMQRALMSRNHDGYDRQRAARDLLADPRPWAAPFLVALIGEYVVEILDDIEAAMSPALHAQLHAFLTGDPDFWYLTRQRVVSYWQVYHHQRTARADYVGTRLIKLLEAPPA